MRILHVTRENEADRRYGIGRSLSPVITQLEAMGHSVRYLYQDDLGAAARRWQQRMHNMLAPLFRLFFGGAGVILLHVWFERLNMGRLAARVAARDQYDCVHLHDPWLAWGYWISRWLYGCRTIKWGLTQHGFGSYTRATQEEGVDYTNGLLRLHHRLERYILSLAKFVVLPTSTAKQQLQRDLQLAICPEHWCVVSHARPTMPLSDRVTARATLGWHDDEFHLVAVGRIAPVKRFSLLIDACVHANRALNITILGAGDISNLTSKMEGNPLLKLNTLSTPNVNLYLSAADLYLSTSLNESFGLANVEAQWCGCPAICTAVGGVPEAVGGGVWLVPGTISAITTAIQKLCDDPNLRQSWVEIGKQSVAMLPDTSQVAMLYETIYTLKK